MKTLHRIAHFTALSIVLLAGFSEPAVAVNLVVTKGWPCNVFLQQPAVPDAVGNFADFNLKDSPNAASLVRTFLVGESSDYLASKMLTVNSRVEQLPFLEPLGFYLKSKTYGAQFGVDVCVPELNTLREDVLSWTVDVSALGILVSPAGGDWFQSAQPKVSMQLRATNCNHAPLSNMSAAVPARADFCEIDGTPSFGNDVLSVGGEPVSFSFKLMANRQAVLRFTIEEQSSDLRGLNWNSGDVQIGLTAPQLPRLTVEDLLGKQLFFTPENDFLNWPGCYGFTESSSMAFNELNLQGPNNSLDLRLTGKDTDCALAGVCPNGNIRANQFSFPLQVFLEDGSLAAPDASPSLGVSQFSGEFDDVSASGEAAFPSHGRISYDAQQDQVFRFNGKSMFSTTMSRLVGPQNWRTCRVWFKRDKGFECALLPDARLQNLCNGML